MGVRPDAIVLIGQRRSGKTSVGRLLAGALGRPFLDTDAIVGELTGLEPAAWLRERGETAFREAESTAVRTAVERAIKSRAVLCTGGGAPLGAGNGPLLRGAGRVVYLRVDPWILAQRSDRDRARGTAPARPALVAEPDREPFFLHVARDPVYRETCHVIVDASGPIGSVVEACLARLL